MARPPDGEGDWLAAADSGIVAFGDARFLGSMGGRFLDRPVTGMVADGVTDGYWMVAADGGIFAFGAPFFGTGWGPGREEGTGRAGTAGAGARGTRRRQRAASPCPPGPRWAEGVDAFGRLRVQPLLRM